MIGLGDGALRITRCLSFPRHHSLRLTWAWLALEEAGSFLLSACPSQCFSDVQRVFSFLWVCVCTFLASTVSRHQGVCSLELGKALSQPPAGGFLVVFPPAPWETSFSHSISVERPSHSLELLFRNWLCISRKHSWSLVPSGFCWVLSPFLSQLPVSD